MFDIVEVASWAAGTACVGWVTVSLFAAYRVMRIPEFAQQSYVHPEQFPKLTVVIPACNEEPMLEVAMRSLLAQDYPDLEVVIIDDRSTDSTPAIVDRLAAEDDRVTPLHITELPEDWLGKMNALHQGTQIASGDWLLFADADVRYEPGALRNTVAFAEQHGYDQIGLIPEVERPSFVHAVLTMTFGIAFALAVPMHRVPVPESKHFFGVGAFNLVRRSAFDRTEGFEWLRMEIADDMGMGLLLHRHGARTWGGLAPASLKLLWYGSAWEMVRGLEKNLYPVMAHLSPARAVAIVAAGLAALVFPLVGLALPAPFGWPMSLAVPLGLTALALAGARRFGGSPLVVLMLPFGLAMLLVALALSARAYWRTGGATWRGTFYPTPKLRTHQRVKL